MFQLLKLRQLPSLDLGLDPSIVDLWCVQEVKPILLPVPVEVSLPAHMLLMLESLAVKVCDMIIKYRLWLLSLTVPFRNML